MNLTADDGAGYFCDGLAEELIDLLARSNGLRLVARTSTFQFKGAQMDVRDIGQRLGADLLIEGAVRGTGDRYRITVRLLSSSDGCEIWAEKYDRTLRDVLELETQIATSVASALSSGTPPPVPRPTARPSPCTSGRATRGTSEPKQDFGRPWNCTRPPRDEIRGRPRPGPVLPSVTYS